jgi:chromosome segregation ATPase
MHVRVMEKESSLTQLEGRQSALTEERTKLLSEIDNNQVTLTDLHAGLDRIRQEIGRLRAETETQQREKQRVEARLQEFQTEISRLRDDQHRPADTAKRERIDSLKKQIKSYLEVMLSQ